MKKAISYLVIILVFSCIGYVSAEIVMNSKDVRYKNKYTTKANVSDTLDELVHKSKTMVIAEPVIKGGLIPVIIEDDGKVKKADTTKTWYDYNKKEWANAIELKSGVTDNYAVNATIPEANIRSYFVWIPKYRYKLWNVNKDGNSTGTLKGEHSIEIEFNIEDTTDIEGVSCATPMESGASGNCDNGEWMTHPAFISMNVTGFWVGKFELGHKDNTTAKAKASMNPSSDAANIVVKPDHYSWTNTSAVNYFNTLLKYNTGLNSHMMKNTEWGAVAYLSHSKYGKDSEININNYLSDYTNWYIKTGYSANINTDQHTFEGTYGTDKGSLWNTSVGHMASTTGNVSGIYDMSGGTVDYVAGFRNGVTDITSSNSKYYDLYGDTNSRQDYKYRILGDATGEMGPFKYYEEYDHNWHGDWSSFVISSLPWFHRGGGAYYGAIAGIFNFWPATDVARGAIGSRLVLSPTK